MTEASTGSAVGQMVPDDADEGAGEATECLTFLKSERPLLLVTAARASVPPSGLICDVAINDGIKAGAAMAVGLPLGERIVVGPVEGKDAIVVGLKGVAAIAWEIADAEVVVFVLGRPWVVLVMELTLGGAAGRNAAPKPVPRAIAGLPGIITTIPTTSASNVDVRVPRLSAPYGLALLIRDSSYDRLACDAIYAAPAAGRAIEFPGY